MSQGGQPSRGLIPQSGETVPLRGHRRTRPSGQVDARDHDHPLRRLRFARWTIAIHRAMESWARELSADDPRRVSELGRRGDSSGLQSMDPYASESRPARGSSRSRGPLRVVEPRIDATGRAVYEMKLLNEFRVRLAQDGPVAHAPGLRGGRAVRRGSVVPATVHTGPGPAAVQEYELGLVPRAATGATR
jgi:hypothetical protein